MAEDLHCPRCGKLFTVETAFCRTCGLSLGPVVDAVNTDVSDKPLVTSRPNYKTIRIGIGLCILGLVIGILNGALREMDLFPQAYGKAIFMIIFAIGLLLMGAGIIFPTKRYSKPKSLSPPRPNDQLPPAQQEFADEIDLPQRTRELERNQAASVTEHTTRNLEGYDG